MYKMFLAEHRKVIFHPHAKKPQ